MLTDLEYLRTMSGGDEKFIKEMIEIFKDQILEYAEEMPKLLKNADYENLSKLAHKAKSSVAVMGMTVEADSLKDLEILARDGIDTDTYITYVDRFIANCKIALAELE